MPETAGRRATRLVATTALLALLAACGRDIDFRQLGPDLRSREPVRTETEPRPEPDARGVISYPGYQMAVARGGDTVTDDSDRAKSDYDAPACCSAAGNSDVSVLDS